MDSGRVLRGVRSMPNHGEENRFEIHGFVYPQTMFLKVDSMDSDP
jgi:hypothetical protein